MSGGRVLPEGWTVLPFKQIAESITERVEDPAAAGVDRYVGLDHLDPESTYIRRWGSPDDVGSTKLRFYPGDVVYARRRAYQRKLGVADFEGICSAHALVLRARPEACLPEFLPYFLQSDAFHERALDISVGSLSPTINWRTLATQEFVLPSRAQQGEIVQVLAQAGREVTALLAVESSAERLWLALAHERLIARSTCRLADRVDVLLGRQRHPKYATGDFMTPYIRAANVKSGYLDLESIYEMNFDPAERMTYGLHHGDVLVSEGCGNIDEVGANAVWEGQIDDPVCFQKALIRLRAGPETTPGLLRHWSRFAFESGLFKTIARGTSIWHVSAERTRELPYPDMTVDEQRTSEFVLTKAEAVLNAVGRHRRDAQRAMSHLREHLLMAGPT